MVYAAFAVGGPEFIALAAGEIRNPRRNIPKCARAVFGRIVGFYVVGVLAVGIICSSRDERLLGAITNGSAGSAASPFVIGIANLGINGLAGLINVLILLSGWSCGNAYMFAASRTLYSLALDGQAPKFFARCTSAGCPIFCVMAVALVSCITFLVSDSGAAVVFGWFIDLATSAFVVSYTCWLATWVGWYRALKAQGVSRDSLHWKAPFMPYGAYIGIGTGCCVLLFLGFDTFVPFSVSGFITGYFAIAWATACFVFWKVLKKTKFVNPQEADLWSGKESVDAECRMWEEDPREAQGTWAKLRAKLR